MYRDAHDPIRGGWTVTDSDGNWVLGPWQNRKIARDLARALNEAAKANEHVAEQGAPA